MTQIKRNKICNLKIKISITIDLKDFVWGKFVFNRNFETFKTDDLDPDPSFSGRIRIRLERILSTD